MAPRTHGGALATTSLTPEQQLRRSVLSTFLFEDQCYEDGKEIAGRIAALVAAVHPEKVKNLAEEARSQMNLRHAPLWLIAAMAKLPTHRKYVAEALELVIQRPDELSEFLSLYWKAGKQPLAAQVKKGLARAFRKFNAYGLAKYNQDNPIKLKDVMFLTHPKPEGAGRTVAAPAVEKAKYHRGETRRHRLGQGAIWKQLISGELEPPDTWEVALSAGGDKKTVFERLIKEEKLGALALLRNLRNMEQVGVNRALVRDALRSADWTRVLPFRFYTAAKHAQTYTDVLDELLVKRAGSQKRLPGISIIVVDVSGSMYGSPVSAKSEVDRAEVACTLAVIAREQCEDARIYATGGDDRLRKHKTQLVPGFHGFALGKEIHQLERPLGGGGIFLKQCLDFIWKQEQEVLAERIIVITDEQDCDTDSWKSPDKAPKIARHEYLINVASAKNGIGYGRWTHVDGWSERVLDYIREVENL